MVKGQVQTDGLENNVVSSISRDPFTGNVPNLVQWMPLESRFLVKGQCQTDGLLKSVARSIFTWLLAGKLPNLLQWMPLENRFYVTWSKVQVKLLVFVNIFLPISLGHFAGTDNPYWCSSHMSKGQGQNAGLWKKIVCSIFKTSNSIALEFLHLEQRLLLENRCTLLNFRSCDQRSRWNCWSSS